MIYFIELK